MVNTSFLGGIFFEAFGGSSPLREDLEMLAVSICHLPFAIMAGWTSRTCDAKKDQNRTAKVLQQLLTIMAILGTVTFIVTLGFLQRDSGGWWK